MTGLSPDSEWRVGWRIVAACALANGTGISLLFLTFNMFVLPMAQDLRLSRSETGLVQSLIVTAALGAPLIGRLADRYGFGLIFGVCTVLLAGIELAQAYWVSTGMEMAVTVALAGFIGGGAASVVLTRPINAHFDRWRGVALGLVGAGVSIAVIVVPPFLQQVIGTHGWRAGFATLAGLALVVGMPLVLALFPHSALNHRPGGLSVPAGSPGRGDRSFARSSDFWFLVVANLLSAIAVSGAVSQLSPMIQDEGFDAATAALGLSVFAFGQLIGKLGGGWLLDRFEPRLVAIVLTVVPSLGYVVLLTASGMIVAVLGAAALIGLLQGADIGIFAYFTARRFGVARYGTVFGALHGLSWVGTAVGAVGFGASFDRYGSYAPAQAVSVGLLLIAALAFIPFRMPQRQTHEPTAGTRR